MSTGSNRTTESSRTAESDPIREAFTMPDGDVTWPFVEDEDANVTGYGHTDAAEFAEAVNRYDEACEGRSIPEDERWDEGFVGHYWVSIAPDGESLLRTTADDPDAIPVTGLWGQR